MTGVTAIMAGQRSVPPLSITSGFVSNNRVGAGTVSAGTSVVRTGGVAPYTFLWEYQNGDTRIGPSTTNTQNTTFSVFLEFSGDSAYANWRVTVTDGAGQTAFADTDVSFSNV